MTNLDYFQTSLTYHSCPKGLKHDLSANEKHTLRLSFNGNAILQKFGFQITKYLALVVDSKS